MSKYILKNNLFRKPKRFIICNEGSNFYVDKKGNQGMLKDALTVVKKNNSVMIFLLADILLTNAFRYFIS